MPLTLFHSSSLVLKQFYNFIKLTFPSKLRRLLRLISLAQCDTFSKLHLARETGPGFFLPCSTQIGLCKCSSTEIHVVYSVFDKLFLLGYDLFVSSTVTTRRFFIIFLFTNGQIVVTKWQERKYLSCCFVTRVHCFATLSQLSHAGKNQGKPLGSG